MVAVLVKLKWAYFKAGFRKNPWAWVGIIFGAFYALGGLVGFSFVAVMLSGNPDAVFTFLVGAGAVISLLWWVVPLVVSGADATLEPDRLVAYPIRTKDLQLGQFIGAFIGLPGIITLLLMLAMVLSLLHAPLAILGFLAAFVLACVTTIAVSRFITVVSLRLRSNRRSSQLMNTLAFLLLIAAGPLLGFASTGLVALWERAPWIVDAVSFTPLASFWGIPAHLVKGQWGGAALCLMLSVIYATVAWWLWHHHLAKTMRNVGAYAGNVATKSVKTGDLGLLGKFPATPRGAIAARTVLTILKDPRASFMVVMIPAFYIIFAMMNSAIYVNGESGGTNFFLVVFLPAMAGYLFAYLVSYDNSAFSMHVLAPLRGIDDRIGRATGVLVVMFPIIVLGTLLMAFVSGEYASLPIMMGLSVMMLLNGIGLGAYMDMVITLPTPPPGTSPWKTQRNPDGFSKGIARAGYMLVLLASSIPGLVFWGVQEFTSNSLWGWVGAVACLVIGCASIMLGLRAGAHRYDAKAAETLQRVTRAA